MLAGTAGEPNNRLQVLLSSPQTFEVMNPPAITSIRLFSHWAAFPTIAKSVRELIFLKQ